jgi:hypothetical protein
VARLRREKRIFGGLIVLAVVGIVVAPTLYYGDGPEYLGMLVALANHGSFELSAADRQWIIGRVDPTFMPYGYFPDLQGRDYCWHFWMYPALCYPVFQLLKLFSADLLAVFKITNTILLLLLGWWILFRVDGSLRNKLCLLAVVFVNPALLYLPWSHPEVYIYVFFFLGLLEFREKRHFTALFLLAVASLQATPLLLVSGFITLYLMAKGLVRPRDYWRLAAANALGLLPMAFYWFHFGTWSLLAAAGAAKFEYASWDKAVNLLFDPNDGLVIYYPLLAAAMVYQVLNKYRPAFLALVILLLLVFSITSQVNWNPGIMYVHRYAVWLIPLVTVSVFGLLSRLPGRPLALFLAGYLTTTGLITAVCAYEYQTDNYLRFLPQTQWLLRHAPALYNPPVKVFAERILGRELVESRVPVERVLNRYLPLQLYDESGLRKELTLNDRGELEYRSGDFSIHTRELYPASSEVDPSVATPGDIRPLFGRGWYIVENDGKGAFWRWMATRSSIALLNREPAGEKVFEIGLRSYYRPRDCTIYLNGAKVFTCKVFAPEKITFTAGLRPGINSLHIVASPRAESPLSKKESGDKRELAFAVSNFSIKADSP